MIVSAFGLDSCKDPFHVPVARHQMLAGINQAVFVRQWGMPQATLALTDLQMPFSVESLSLRSETTEAKNPLVAWIYETKDRLLVFRKEKLVSHFRWSDVRERMKRQKTKETSQGSADVLLPSWKQ